MKIRFAIGALTVVASVPFRADAAVQFFDNYTRTFELTANGGAMSPHGLLDPTRSPADQVNLFSSRSIAYTFNPGGGSETPVVDGFVCGSDLRIIVADELFTIANRAGTAFHYVLARALIDGDVVGDGARFRAGGGTALVYSGGNRFHDPLIGRNPLIGFQIQLPDGVHYGYVQFEFGTGPLFGSQGRIPMFQPVAWAYETTPGMPIIVPSAGGAGLLVLSGLAAGLRRRQRG